MAPDRGLPCALQKTNVRRIRTSKQPLPAEKAVPRMLWKEVGGAGPPADGEAWGAQPGAGLAQSLGRTGRKQAELRPHQLPGPKAFYTLFK